MTDPSTKPSNVVKLFPDSEDASKSRNKMDRHQHSSLEVLIIAVANRQSVDTEALKSDLCRALGVQFWEHAPYNEAQAWLKNQLVTGDK